MTEVNKNSNNAQQKMVQGSIWMTVGSILSRLLGAIYILPWYKMMGENALVANSLFTKGYNIYAVFLMISTAGIPSAVARQISKYNAMNEYGVSQRLFKRALTIMFAVGVVCAGIMFIGAPALAKMSAGGDDLVMVIRALSIAVLAFPCMSVIRGYFQGNQDMMPSAVSQIVEQIGRVFYMLLSAYIIMEMWQGNYVNAVVHSTFAAFIGMIFAYVILIYYYIKHKKQISSLIANSANKIEISENTLLKEIVVEAIPFIIVGSAITIFKLVDQVSFEKIMAMFTGYSDKELSEIFSLISGNPDKLTMIIISLATALGTVSLPLVTEAYTNGEHKDLARFVGDNIQLFFFVMLPATIGMIVVAVPINTLFYSYDPIGSALLVACCISSIFLGYFMVISSILQGIYQNKTTLVTLLVGFIIKVVLQYPMIFAFEAYGPIIATTIGFAVSCYLMTRSVFKITKFNIHITRKRAYLIVLMSAIMAIAAVATRVIAYNFLSYESKTQSFVIVMLVAIVGVGSYGYLALKTRIADRLLGEKVGQLRNKLHIK